MSGKLHERGRIGALSRSRANDDPELVEARRNLAYERLREQVEYAIRDWPKMSDDQRTTIVDLLNAGGVR